MSTIRACWTLGVRLVCSCTAGLVAVHVFSWPMPELHKHSDMPAVCCITPPISIDKPSITRTPQCVTATRFLKSTTGSAAHAAAAGGKKAATSRKPLNFHAYFKALHAAEEAERRMTAQLVGRC